LGRRYQSNSETSAGAFGIKVIKHEENPEMPDMTAPETAFQMNDPDENSHDSTYDFKLRLNKPIYLARQNPHMLARAVMDAGRQVCLQQRNFLMHAQLQLPADLVTGSQESCLCISGCTGGAEAWDAANHGAGGSAMHTLHAR
jgi:hypothetical protein